MHCCIRVQLVHVTVQVGHVLPAASRLVQEPRELLTDLDVLVDKTLKRAYVNLSRRNLEPDIPERVTYILPRVNHVGIGKRRYRVAKFTEPVPQINVIQYVPL